MAYDPDLLAVLCCPVDRSDLVDAGESLVCRDGHAYPIVEGVPILLLADKEQTIGIARASLAASHASGAAPLYLDTLGLSEGEKQGIAATWRRDSPVDAVISFLIGATSGWGYKDAIGRLDAYPIPRLPLPAGQGRRLLDVGCSWGRWTVSAARKGWRTTGIDPSLGAILASKRAFSRERLPISFVCGDARHLPFKAGSFDVGFSYSVLQHFDETDANSSFAELGRVLVDDGLAKVQMAHAGGLRSTYVRSRSDYIDSGVFRVRYWTLGALREAFTKHIGPTTIAAEGFGGLGLLHEDWNVVNARSKLLIAASAVMKATTKVLPPLIRIADSVYVTARKS